MNETGVQRESRPDARVPAERAARDRLRDCAADFVARRRLVPPLAMDDLRVHARALVVEHRLPLHWADYLMVLLNNAIWGDTVARVPFDRRVILLPQCLRDRENCPASIDALGLLCEQCGRCPIGGLQAEAEGLGYVVIVAEGTTMVTRLIESGKIDAVIGVSCLGALERAFPHLAAEAIPGIAIPLLRDGCHHTCADLDWVRDAIRLRSSDAWITRADLDRLRTTVQSWFEPAALAALFGSADSPVEQLGHTWMERGGKRWRPFLLATVWQALHAEDRAMPQAIRHLAVAVECFHKASLIHDDIEDGDDLRYGQPTMHREEGIPVAINAGDWLLGEGYGQIARCGAPPAAICAMLDAAADGHRTLCLGQGDELAWMNRPEPLSVEAVLNIFRRKTAPAFEVALRLGAIAGGGDAGLEAALRAFSSALGVAYQIRDDLDDLREPPRVIPGQPRLSILPALACEMAGGDTRADVAAAWLSPPAPGAAAFDLDGFIVRSGAAAKALQLMEHHKNEAVRSLEPLRNAQLKTLLRRIVGRLVPRG
jgi:geranylgeranyl diphosphate synthase, type II